MSNLWALDCEVYPNYFLIALKNVDTQEVKYFETDDSFSNIELDSIKSLLRKIVSFGFNSLNYDLPIIAYCLSGAKASDIHKLSKGIIEKGLKGWQTLKILNLPVLPIKHFDIQEISPGVRVSLKLYGARMHSKKLQDLPYDPMKNLTLSQKDDVRKYCINDLDTTIDLYDKVKDRVKLRIDMSKIYGQEIISKSDAQIAEVVIKKELFKLDNESNLKSPVVSKNSSFSYRVPNFISFNSSYLNGVLELIKKHRFTLDEKGSITLPKDIKNLKIKIGETLYQLGIGGIHSCEKSKSTHASDNYYLVDKDVASYYPSIILNLELFPRHLGKGFLNVYRKIVNERLKAKHDGNKVLNESLKIVINGSFGKFGNKYSTLYSPDLMIAVTLTGQLSLLMLIEKLEECECSVVSANTDGFVTLVPKEKLDIYEDICFDWELKTGFILETAEYEALYSRDVNNYLAVTPNKFKGKGIFTLNELSKNPQANISVLAVIDYLKNKTPIERTILECKDIREFLTVRSVTGGAKWRNSYLGRVVRWIYSKNGEAICYEKNGNKVAKSDGARPIMELETEMPIPEDIDYDRYISEAIDILEDLGLTNFLNNDKPKTKRKTK